MKRIMIVDDEENIRFLYKEELEEEGFTVELAKNGRRPSRNFLSLNPTSSPSISRCQE
jgi:DNA-binding response OmpR family regulator